jgi:hypothetical protein
MDGIVLRWVSNRYSGGQIQGPDRKYDVSGADVECDCIGRVLLVPNEPVSFDPAPPKKRWNGKTGRHHATNVRRPWKRTDIDLERHRETCEVIDRGQILARMTGGLLTPDGRDFSLADGQVVTCGVAPPTKGRMWRAINIEVISEMAETFGWASQFVEPELEEPSETVVAAIPEAAEPSILLSERFKNKKLRDIGLRRIES